MQRRWRKTDPATGSAKGVSWMSALGLGKSRHPFRCRRAATLTLHFCDEDFASDVRKNQPRRTREYPRTDVRTPHVMPALSQRPPPLAFTEGKFDWRSRAFAARRWFGMMRYRSATVAEFHGFPRCLGWYEKERERLKLAEASSLNAFPQARRRTSSLKISLHRAISQSMRSSHQHIRNRRYVTCQGRCVLYVSPQFVP